MVIVTASFEGEPADNAAQFFEWVMHLKSADALKGVRYAIFGCGHHDWVSTNQKVPIALDEALTGHGATRLADRGDSDVALGAVFHDFDFWLDQKLWPTLGPRKGERPVNEIGALDMDISSSTRVSELRYALFEAMVESARTISAPDVNEKRILSFRLPTGVSYSAGNYLSVLPLNPPPTINRVLRRFHLS